MSRHSPFSTRIGHGLVLVMTAALLTACAGNAYVDSRREAGKRMTVGASNADVVAICYAGGEPPPDHVQKLADTECAKTGRTARFESRTRIACNLMNPNRGFFRCVKPDAPAPG